MLRSKVRRTEAVRQACEMLERRMLLCGVVSLINGVPEVHSGSMTVDYTDELPQSAGGPENAGINWTNRGSSASDTDNFNALFGANADTARNVVDQAISNWTRVIDHFNQTGGGNSINVTISMNTTGAGFGSIANVTWNTGDNKPRSATITLGRGNDLSGDGIGDGDGWFLDPTPFEHSEFLGTIFNGYAAQAQTGSPAAGLSDLLTVVDHELGHAVGLIGGIGGIVARTTNTNVSDTATGPMFGQPNAGNFYRWDGNDGSRILWTAHDTAFAGNNAGQAAHIAPGTWTNPTTNITYTGNRDLMNAYFAGGIRTLVSPLHTAMLADALGYTIASSPQTFGTFYNHRLADGRVILRGHDAGTGADFFSVSRSGSFLNTSVTLNAPPAGTGSGATFSMSYFIDPTTNVVIQGDSGPDTITINPVNLPVSIDGHLAGASSPADDLVTIIGSANADVININGGQIAGANHNITQLRNINRLVVNLESGADTVNVSALSVAATINGGAGNDVLNLGTGSFDVATISAPISFNGGIDTDTLNMGNGNADAVIANVIFNGDAGANDQIVYRDTSVAYRVEYSVTGAAIQRDGFFSPRTVSYFNTTRIIIHAGSDHDLITVGNGVGPIVEAYGNGGDDTFVRGVINPGGGSLFNGGPGTNTITFDGTAENVARLWDIYPDRVIYAGIVPYLTTGFASVEVLAGGGDDTITFFGGSTIYTQSITVDGGGGSDNIRTNGSRVPSATLRGGGGFDFLSVDDRALTANLDSYALYSDRYVRYRYDGPDSYTAYYSGFESMTAWRVPTQTFVEIFGTSPDIASTHHTWMVGNTSDSAVYIYPRDAQGNLTIQSNIELGAGGTIGTDHITISDGSSLPMNYRLYNRFANTTAHIDGMGAGWVAIDGAFDSITLNGGSGNDVFNIDSYRSGSALAINGGNGNDTVHWTPTSKDLGNIGVLSSFNFNGGPGHDEMRFHNDNSTSAYTYYPSGSGFGALRHSTGAGMGSIAAANIELMYVSGTPQADGFNIWGATAGTVLELTGRGGNDVYGLSGILPTTVQGIRTLVKIDGSGGGDDTISVNATEDSVGRTVHLTQDTIGAYPGDNLFGPGGSVQFSSITGNIQLHLGSGADTVYARPNTSATVTIHANNPTAAPGDRLYLALAGAGSYAINGTAASGNVTSGNLRTLNWTGFETGPAIDDIAPVVTNADINVNGINDFTEGVSLRRQSIDVHFSEDVSALISPAWLELINLTTNQPIPESNMAVQYDAPTNTARFTFPGYVNGVLPDGNYSGRVLAGLPDFFGNPLPSDADFSFFFLQGDANHDGVVNLQDFNILATNFGQSPRTFSQGDFNYDGVVNLQDFNILAGRFGVALAPGTSAGFGTARIGSDVLEPDELAELVESMA